MDGPIDPELDQPGEEEFVAADRIGNDDFVGEIMKGSDIDASPGAMQALARGGVPAWREYLREHGIRE